MPPSFSPPQSCRFIEAQPVTTPSVTPPRVTTPALTTPPVTTPTVTTPTMTTPLATTPTGRRASTSQRSRTLDVAGGRQLWRKQVCEVRPSRSATLARFPSAQASDITDDKSTTSTVLGPKVVSSPSLTPAAVASVDEPAAQRPRAPRPPARSSSDCCRCRWLRAAASNSLPAPADPGVLRRALPAEGDRQRYGSVGLPPPSPRPVGLLLRPPSRPQRYQGC